MVLTLFLAGFICDFDFLTDLRFDFLLSFSLLSLLDSDEFSGSAGSDSLLEFWSELSDCLLVSPELAELESESLELESEGSWSGALAFIFWCVLIFFGAFLGDVASLGCLSSLIFQSNFGELFFSNFEFIVA
jgi:hypothetical protein